MSFNFKNDPLDNFLELFKKAQIKGVPDHNAMALATVNEKNQPSVRIVLFKGLVDRGFSFFTNYGGHKGKDIEINPAVSANFFWPHLDQQIRIDGIAKKLSAEESDLYFASRPRLSQIGAWSSNQSEKIESFEALQEKINSMELKFAGKPILRPPHWGGYRIIPNEIEFWFGRSGRLHERYVYQKQNSDWDRFLRAP
ncbi:MAG: pyridoxamine 5'-phosphate oxidase [Pseudobdellovibrio sp.]